ncbi:perlwapin-like [Fundulus heteroclitus]|uniref:perlwapin-like n=1 Tax=Fundulus heteroclitus TaxID=8078 RepID=UPI00165A67BD|nr:perlwapin-like [Fundulus heteroclitus]
MRMCSFTRVAFVFAFGLCVQGYTIYTKPAQPGCPDIKGKVGVCAELCSCDSDCRHGEKCCSNGCGHECMSTNPDKPGGCGPPWFSFLCGHPCHHDSDCPGQKKCCPTLCSYTCQEPYQPHCS